LAGERFPSGARIGRGSEIRRILRIGKRVRTGPVDGFFAPSPTHRPRFAVIVPRFGHTIVRRNLVKRRVREVVRREWLSEAHRLGLERDLVLKARPSAYEASFEDVRSALHEVFGRCRED